MTRQSAFQVSSLFGVYNSTSILMPCSETRAHPSVFRGLQTLNIIIASPVTFAFDIALPQKLTLFLSRGDSLYTQ